ncbi:3-dehydroquinate synthase [Flammeovirga kamogawensis]|uniref:3-dehydroquinate synthase n=1 Tax=Flammeovirga kamogawensis TaxID=373891 RepID=A0ABX8GVC3_9BACT|nr:3-dehydroquinate synthase [Flammeovirga kamogawensis]MBB6460973.1 3-dehydroquinate synthase [Flammeovirga kamogawensis]QWG07545.1 3-dehydroquinate synthase [Flammeovirga kamogawensis]TRX69357.1 3-dehydroquinate synthase [Flammeovirga kamogawensis]
MSINKVSFLSELDASTFKNLQSYTSLAVIVDENTKRDCYPLVSSLLPEHILIEVVSGEENKTLDTCQHIWQELTNAGFDRKAAVLDLGGGVIGDMGGFCASTYKRGIDFWQMPTTLLSQVDASVGGKLGIDFGKLKNHIGVFNIPDMVLIYPEFINTLPANELRSGFAEVIKHCLIADAKHWDTVSKKPLEEQDLATIIPHSINIKDGVVTSDPTEKGMRKILNFGHTAGHAIESYLLDIPGRKLLHGEAIAIGMIAEAYLSTKFTGLNESELKEIQEYILSVYGKVEIKETDLEHLYAYLLQDKKNTGKKLSFSLLSSIGTCTYDQFIEWADIEEAYRYYMSL